MLDLTKWIAHNILPKLVQLEWHRDITLQIKNTFNRRKKKTKTQRSQWYKNSKFDISMEAICIFKLNLYPKTIHPKIFNTKWIMKATPAFLFDFSDI